MTIKSEIGKSLFAAICALFFGSTMILSAVGPARASSDVARIELAKPHITPANGHYLA